MAAAVQVLAALTELSVGAVLQREAAMVLTAITAAKDSLSCLNKEILYG